MINKLNNKDILEFERMISPDNESGYNQDNEIFLKIKNKLKNQYVLTKYNSQILNNELSLSDVANSQIRSIIQNERGEKGNVKWDERRTFINNLVWERKEIQNNVIEIIYDDIKNHTNKYYELTIDAKLEALINMLENKLKVNNKYINLDDINFLIPNENVRKIKQKFQCFRHSSEESLKERKLISEYEKKSYCLILEGIVVWISEHYSKHGNNNKKQ